jgi:hypothetical protein
MASGMFYVVYIDRDPNVSLEMVTAAMDKAVDWYRINESLWIVYTTSDADKWNSRLRPLTKESGNFFICKLDTANRQGWMSKGFWKWLRRED